MLYVVGRVCEFCVVVTEGVGQCGCTLGAVPGLSCWSIISSVSWLAGWLAGWLVVRACVYIKYYERARKSECVCERERD